MLLNSIAAVAIWCCLILQNDLFCELQGIQDEVAVIKVKAINPAQHFLS
jgi:hypothetical protein